MKKTLWHILASKKGGDKRVQIINALSERPYNANQLAGRLGVHYNTVRHHLSVLEEHNIVESGGEEYGRMYYLTERFEKHREEFDRIAERTTDSQNT